MSRSFLLGKALYGFPGTPQWLHTWCGGYPCEEEGRAFARLSRTVQSLPIEYGTYRMILYKKKYSDRILMGVFVLLLTRRIRSDGKQWTIWLSVAQKSLER